jgi:hypothetical protein
MPTDLAQSRALLSLRETMKGQTLLPSNEGYHQARQIWNGAVARYPAALSVCETVEDVQAAVRAAVTNRMALPSAAAAMTGLAEPCATAVSSST